MPPMDRQTAYKVWVKQIHEASFVKPGGWAPSYIDVGGKQVSRVNVLATVVGKFLSEDGNYAAVTLDDGTDTIRSKAFGPDVKILKDIKIGAIVRFIGKIKQYNEETYLAPEIMRSGIDPNWIVVHKLELGAIMPRVVTESDEPVKKEATIAEAVRQSNTIEENPSTKLASLIKELDKGSGADLNKVIEKSGMEVEDAKNVLAGLLKAGDVFEPKKGRLKLLE